MDAVSVLPDIRMAAIPLLLLLQCAIPAPAAGPVVTFDLAPVPGHRSPQNTLEGRSATSEDILPPAVGVDGALVFDGTSAVILPIVVESAEEPDEGFTRLWADLDDDGHYGTNEFVELKAYGASYARVPEFTAVVTDAGFRRPATFSGSLSGWHRKKRLSLRSSSAFAGTAHVEGMPVTISVSDTDGDGRIAQFMGDRPHDAGAELQCARGTNTADILPVPLAPTMGLLGVFYAVDLAFTGSVAEPHALLKLTPVDMPTADLAITGQGVEALGLAGSGISMLLNPVDGSTAAPEGSWWMVGLHVKEGDRLFCSRQRHHGNTADVTIGQDDTNTLSAGGPLQHEVSVSGARSTGRLSLSLGTTRGIGGRDYQPLARGGKAPGWIVRRPGGDTIVTGDFEYG